jgi:paraquat-inducible protein B
MDMVGRGVQSGGVMLANRNAGNSSAAQAIANAYAKLGQRQMNSIGNQYATAQSANDLSQTYLNQDKTNAQGAFHTKLMDSVNSIVTSASDKLRQLNETMAYASMPQRVAIEQQASEIRNQALAALQGYDAQLQTGLDGVQAADRGTNVGKANTLLASGQADPNLFNYTTQAPMQMQGTGPVASDLPIFTYNKNKQLA